MVMAFGGIEGVSFDPKIRSDGIGPVDGILATAAGQTPLSALRSVVYGNDLALREELTSR